MSREFALKQVTRCLESERKKVNANLELMLKNLKQRVEMALTSLKEGGSLDEHLIVNASSITGLIARYNLVRDLSPYLDEVKEK